VKKPPESRKELYNIASNAADYETCMACVLYFVFVKFLLVFQAHVRENTG
jgi:hypothetical protein